MGAGKPYYPVPVLLKPKPAGGDQQTYSGCYTMHLGLPSAQATPPYQGLGFQTADVQQAASGASLIRRTGLRLHARAHATLHLAELGGALAGWFYIRMAPRRGFAFTLSERWYGLRNGYYRWKRRRAARKFEVYMRKQGRTVRFDGSGRRIDDDEDKKRWN